MDAEKREPAWRRPSRRSFIKGAAALAASAAVGPIAVSCGEDENPQKVGSERLDYLKEAPITYADNVPPPPQELHPERLGFFTSHEAKTIDALTARIMPGDPSDPGAREAGLLSFIDIKLSAYEGFWEPTYREGPFAETVDSGPGSAEPVTKDGHLVVLVPKDELERYGFQSMMTPREIYRSGIVNLDAYSQQKFGAQYADLSEQDQDSILDDLGKGDIDAFKHPTASTFYKTVRTDVIEGMFGDPAYGGNRDMVGWKLVGYPGAQRGYTPEDMHTESNNRPYQSLADLHAYMEGHVNDNTISPVSSEDQPNQLEKPQPYGTGLEERNGH